MGKIIYHICAASDWENNVHAGYYEHPSLELEGFIHCSTERQVPIVLSKYFSGENNLIKIHIDVSLLDHEMLYEEASDGDFYPHIYGQINLSAVVKTEPINDRER